MTPPTEEFRVEMTDGLIIERLPVGLANQHWHLAFVCSGLDFLEGEPPRAVGFSQEFRQRVIVTAVDGTLEYRGGGGVGGEDDQEVRMRFLQDGLEAIEVTYLQDGTSVASGVVDLS